MFGKRSNNDTRPTASPAAPSVAPVAAPPLAPASPVGGMHQSSSGRTPLSSEGLGAAIVTAPSTQSRAPVPTAVDSRRSESYYETKGTIFGALIEAIDLAQLARLE